MPISGLVIVLDDRAGAAPAVMAKVRADPRFTLGTNSGQRVAAVLETSSQGEGRACLEWVEALPGVALVQVAYVDHSDLVAEKEKTPHGG